MSSESSSNLGANQSAYALVCSDVADRAARLRIDRFKQAVAKNDERVETLYSSPGDYAPGPAKPLPVADSKRLWDQIYNAIRRLYMAPVAKIRFGTDDDETDRYEDDYRDLNSRDPQDVAHARHMFRFVRVVLKSCMESLLSGDPNYLECLLPEGERTYGYAGKWSTGSWELVALFKHLGDGHSGQLALDPDAKKLPGEYSFLEYLHQSVVSLDHLLRLWERDAAALERHLAAPWDPSVSITLPDLPGFRHALVEHIRLNMVINVEASGAFWQCL